MMVRIGRNGRGDCGGLGGFCRDLILSSINLFCIGPIKFLVIRFRVRWQGSGVS
jgi:hypothetical protein